jgi:nitrate ABC transporter ATP-binding subunit
MNDDRYLEITQLTKAYATPDGGRFVVTENFDLQIRRSEFVCLIGHSGCGKSTVLSMVAGLLDADSGGVVLDGKEVVGAGPDRGVVFQAPCLLPWLTAYENVMIGVRRVFWHGSAAERDSIVRHYLRVVGLGDAAGLRPAELSRGMCQRVSLARAFALAPKVLLLDEPFGMLDSLTRMDLQSSLTTLCERTDKTALMVTHDVDEALFLADRIVMMTNGPNARVGDILTVPFERPRIRSRVLEHHSYYELRGRLIEFLVEQEHSMAAARAA